MTEDKNNVEAAVAVPPVVVAEDKTDKPLFGKRSMKELAIDALIWALLTVYFAVFFVRARGKDGFEAFTILYVFITLRLIARHVSVSQIFYEPIGKVASAVAAPFEKIPALVRNIALIVVTLAIMMIVMLTNPVSGDNTILARFQSLIGIVAFIALMYATSTNRAAIPWYTVATGLLSQYIIALLVLRTQIGFNVFNYISLKITTFLKYSEKGLEFLLTPEYNHNNFAASVLPTIIYFCSFVSIVYYFGGMQYVISKMAWLMMRLMDVSGAEAVVATASPFIGQGENALLVRPFVEYMTRSELHSIMTSGFATISGSVLLFYIIITGNASALLTACVMSIPASLLLSKMRYPENEEPLTKGNVRIPENEEKEANFLHAAGNGSATGIQLVLLIAAALIAIVALFAVCNDLFGNFFAMIDIYDTVNPPLKDGRNATVTIQFVLSYIFYPVAWLLGIPAADARKAGEVMAVKLVVNEFVAYSNLGDAVAAGMFSKRTADLLVYALCGFANVASIGIQLGCLGAIAPSRKKDLSELAFSAMLTGTVSTWLTAAVAGTLM